MSSHVTSQFHKPNAQGAAPYGIAGKSEPMAIPSASKGSTNGRIFRPHGAFASTPPDVDALEDSPASSLGSSVGSAGRTPTIILPGIDREDWFGKPQAQNPKRFSKSGLSAVRVTIHNPAPTPAVTNPDEAALRLMGVKQFSTPQSPSAWDNGEDDSIEVQNPMSGSFFALKPQHLAPVPEPEPGSADAEVIVQSSSPRLIDRPPTEIHGFHSPQVFPLPAPAAIPSFNLVTPNTKTLERSLSENNLSKLASAERRHSVTVSKLAPAERRHSVTAGILATPISSAPFSFPASASPAAQPLKAPVSDDLGKSSGVDSPSLSVAATEPARPPALIVASVELTPVAVHAGTQPLPRPLVLSPSQNGVGAAPVIDASVNSSNGSSEKETEASPEVESPDGSNTSYSSSVSELRRDEDGIGVGVTVTLAGADVPRAPATSRLTGKGAPTASLALMVDPAGYGLHIGPVGASASSRFTAAVPATPVSGMGEFGIRFDAAVPSSPVSGMVNPGTYGLQRVSLEAVVPRKGVKCCKCWEATVEKVKAKFCCHKQNPSKDR